MNDLPALPLRPTDAHKGTFGRVLLIGGSRGMAGSIALSSMAAMRSGVGLGHVAVPSAILETVASFEPCVMTHPLSCDLDGRLTLTAHEEIADLLDRKTAVAIGPGLSRADLALSLAQQVIRTTSIPMVVDADALVAVADDLSVLDDCNAPRVLTPHPGEFSRLVCRPVPSDDESRKKIAMEFAGRYSNVVLVLKGAKTVVTDGRETVINQTGNVGMATAGSGDVLTGVIVALLGQGMSAMDAAVLGVYAHGLAGDLAARRRGEMGLIASDLIQYLPRVWKRMEREQ